MLYNLFWREPRMVSIENPILGYKLDPGEPGIPYSAPASRSILRVLSQEISNLMAFKKEAVRNGGYVIYGRISLDLRKRGSFLAATAGKTQVYIYYPGREEKTSEQRFYLPQIKNTSVRELERKINELERKYHSSSDPFERQNIRRNIIRLRLALNALKSGLNIPEFLIGVLIDHLV